MTSVRRKIVSNIQKLLDLCTMIAALGAGAWVGWRESGAVSLTDFLSVRVALHNFVIVLGLICVWHVTFASFGLYRQTRFRSLRSELLAAIKAVNTGTLIIALVAAVFRIEMMTRVFVLVFWATSAGSAIVSRLVLRRILIWFRHRGRNLRHLLIIGSNQRAIDFAQEVEQQRELGYKVVGFADEEWVGLRSFDAARWQIVSSLTELPLFLRSHVIDEVVISLPLKSHYQDASRILQLCHEHGIVVRYLAEIFGSTASQIEVENLEGNLMISHYVGAMNGWQVLAKRGIDILLATCLFITILPLFLIVSLLVKLTSPGPIFFVQKRVGLGKRTFRLYKFRSMVNDAEIRIEELAPKNEMDGPVFKIENDPRVTPLGKLLRKSSIDELPQLINIIKGDMSFVGPRPLPVRDYNGFHEDWQRRRFSVKPGLTCLWQISGRNRLPFTRWMELDLQYIDSWSLSLDLKILLRTIPAVIRGTGAA